MTDWFIDKASNFLSLKEEFLGRVSLSKRIINISGDAFGFGESCDLDVRVWFRFDERTNEQLIIKKIVFGGVEKW